MQFKGARGAHPKKVSIHPRFQKRQILVLYGTSPIRSAKILPTMQLCLIRVPAAVQAEPGWNLPRAKSEKARHKKSSTKKNSQAPCPDPISPEPSCPFPLLTWPPWILLEAPGVSSLHTRKFAVGLQRSLSCGYPCSTSSSSRPTNCCSKPLGNSKVKVT